MFNTKTLLAAASLAVLTAAGMGAANAAPWDNHRPVVRQQMRHDMRQERRELRRIVDRQHVLASLRLHHLRGLSEPYFVRGHYVVRVMGRFGRTHLVEVNPYTGAFIGEFRT